MISLVAGRRRLINVATVLAALAVLAMATPAAADNPTPQGNRLWSNGATSTYKWDASVPAWLRPVMTNVLETTWADPATNNSNGPRFSYSTTGSGTIQYLASNSVCGSGGWLGCADARYVPAWKIWLTSNPQSVGYGKNWCDLSLVSGCPDAGRVAIHEVGHVGGFLDHNPTTVWAETRMRSPSFPFYNTSTWNTRTLGRCDEARLQLMYDVKSQGGPYADCFDNITNAGNDGLVLT